MFVRISNTPRPYAWGSTTAIAELLGTVPTGEPEAELWLGAHPGSPSIILDPSDTGGAANLAEWIAADPSTTLGRYAGSGRLPFLLKILAAGAPLSLQAHPTPEQAVEGFARENAAGIPLDAAHRNYKDAFPKPELMYALSPRFEALCGFRPLEETLTIIRKLLALDAGREDPQPHPLEDLYVSLSAPDGLRTTFEWLISRATGVATLVALVSQLAELGDAPELDIARELSAEYPGDPGIVISLLINGVAIEAGEALYLPAGNIHAYLKGLGVELMAASDNVLRGGLTPKHIDIPELLSVLDFTPVPVPYLVPSTPSEGVEVFGPAGQDFALVRVAGADLDAGFGISGPAILIATEGSVTIIGEHGTESLERGQSAYVTPDEGALRFGGSGTLFLATTAAP
jgi:mannose-6-phosphate isomerase